MPRVYHGRHLQQPGCSDLTVSHSSVSFHSTNRHGDPPLSPALCLVPGRRQADQRSLRRAPPHRATPTARHPGPHGPLGRTKTIPFRRYTKGRPPVALPLCPSRMQLRRHNALKGHTWEIRVPEVKSHTDIPNQAVPQGVPGHDHRHDPQIPT